MGILNSGGTCTKQIGTDIIEQVLAYRVGEEYQCCDFCKETKGCEAYTFDQYDGGMCWLKYADVPLVRKDGIKSGINAQGIKFPFLEKKFFTQNSSKKWIYAIF